MNVYCWKSYKGSVEQFQKDHGNKFGWEPGIIMRVRQRDGTCVTVVVGDLMPDTTSTSGCGCCADAYFSVGDEVIAWMDLRSLVDAPVADIASAPLNTKTV